MEQSPQDRRAAAERQVRDDFEGLTRDLEPSGISLDHLWKPATQVRGKLVVDLDCDDTRTGVHERAGQNAGARAEVEHEVTAPDVGSANELRCELATAEKVPTASALCSRTDGHGEPPCT